MKLFPADQVTQDMAHVFITFNNLQPCVVEEYEVAYKYHHDAAQAMIGARAGKSQTGDAVEYAAVTQLADIAHYWWLRMDALLSFLPDDYPLYKKHYV